MTSKEAVPDSVAGPIVLIGLSGSGKTAVGRLLAARLGWRLVDLDAEVERLAGASISAVFEERGESGFREMESFVTRSTTVDRRTVVATGGGWMARPELRDTWPDAVRVWLRVEPGSALSRLAPQRFTRPLLAGPEPEAELRRLLAERTPTYRLAEIAVRTDGLAPEAVASAILEEIAAPDRAGQRPDTP